MSLTSKLPWCQDHLVPFAWGLPPNLHKEFRKLITTTPADLSRVILILESPHFEEFKPDNQPEQWGPARGRSGCSIMKNLMKILQSANAEVQTKAQQCRELVLLNAIQHQCSEGLRPLNEVQRDANFAGLWRTGGGQKDFQYRIGKLYKKSDVVILACTRGNNRPRKDKPTLRGLVREALFEMVPQIHIDIACCHPCRWNNPMQRILPKDWE